VISRNQQFADAKQILKSNLRELEAQTSALEKALAARDDQLELAARDEVKKDEQVKRCRSKLNDAVSQFRPE
jgi:hypothetical protein